MKKRLGTGIAALGMAAAILGCGLVNDVKDVVQTVDESVSLLQEISSDGSWERVSNGLDQLAIQTQGYLATATLREGSADAVGNFAGALSQDVTITMQVDGENEALAHVVTPNGAEDYFIQGVFRDDGTNYIYRITQGRYACVSDNAGSQQMRRGLRGFFDNYALVASGVQLLTVAEEAGESTVAGRPTTHYVLESRMDRAKEILARFDSEELRQRVDSAGSFTINGTIDVDQETGALLRFDSHYYRADQQRRLAFTFEVTQWGGVPDIAPPTPDQIDVPCTTP